MENKEQTTTEAIGIDNIILERPEGMSKTEYHIKRKIQNRLLALRKKGYNMHPGPFQGIYDQNGRYLYSIRIGKGIPYINPDKKTVEQ